MKFSIAIDGQDHTLEIVRDGASGRNVAFLLDGAAAHADVAAIKPDVYSLLIGGKSFTVRVAPAGGGPGEYAVEAGGVHYAVSLRDPRRMARGGRAKLAIEGKQNVTALMPGKVLRVLICEGQAVESGQGLIVVEAMKMQNEIKCPKAGKIQKVLVREGQAVNAGDILLAVE